MSSSRKTSTKPPQTRSRPQAQASSTEQGQGQELDALDRLHALMTRLLEVPSLALALEEILDASIDLLHADFGLVQVYQPETGSLLLVGQRGFSSDFIERFRVVPADSASACARSVKIRERVIIEDAGNDPLFATCREVVRDAGFLAVQSTPLIGTGGRLLGALSTHYRLSRRPRDYDLRVLDLYARLAADVIERLRAAENLDLREAQLRRSEAKFSTAFEKTPQGLTITSLKDGRLIEVNDSFLRVTGFTREETVGRTPDELGLWIEPSQRAARFARLIAGEPVADIEARFRRKNGQEVIGVIGSALIEIDGQPCVLSSVVDITEQKRAEADAREAEQRFARFMENLPGLAWIKNAQGHYIFVNQAAAESFGRSRDELYGKTDDDIFPPATAALFRHNDELARLTPGGVQTVEMLSHPDGSEHHSLVGKFQIPASAGQGTMIGGIAVDISDRVRAERALQEADRRKDEFIATLAHELRNPLMPLGVAAEILNSNADSGGNSPEIAQIVKRQVDNLARLVDDLLEISRITLGKIVLRQTDAELHAIIGNSIEITHPHMQHARHQLEVSLPDEAVSLQVDPLRVTQIIANLLNNAAKYTPDGGQISLRARVEGDHVVVRVRDNGIGIAPGHLPYIFDMFAQPNRSAQNTQAGMGIGLSLARKLAELHGGTLSAASPGVNRGSELTLSIPRQTAAAQTAPASPAVEVSDTVSKTLRILIADDNHGAADIMAIALRSMRARVRVVYDGAAAVAATAEFKPHIVFMDIGMSGMDGHEAARRIRAQPENKSTVLIAVSGWGQDDIRRLSEEAGFNHHAVKPLGLQELRRLVQAHAQTAFRGRSNAGRG